MKLYIFQIMYGKYVYTDIIIMPDERREAYVRIRTATQQRTFFILLIQISNMRMRTPYDIHLLKICLDTPKL